MLFRLTDFLPIILILMSVTAGVLYIKKSIQEHIYKNNANNAKILIECFYKSHNKKDISVCYKKNRLKK